MEGLELAQQQEPEQVYHAEERTEAQEPAGDATLAKEVVAESRRQRRRILRGVSALLTSWGMLYYFLWLFETVGLYKGWYLPDGLIAPFLTLSFLGSMALCALFAMPSRRQKERLRDLARTADLNVVGPMIEMLGEIQPRHTRAALRDAVTELFPRLKESDTPLLSTRQRAKVHAILDDALLSKRRYPVDFVLALLKGLEQVGDAQSARHVRRLAAMPAGTEKRARIRAAAADTLAVIEARLARLKSPSVLLRAAETAPDEPSLLRPAGASGREPAALLLHTTSEE